MAGRRRPLFSEPDSCFKVGRHLLRLVQVADLWAASVDGLSAGEGFSSQVQAWGEGVRVAMALDATSSGPPQPPVGTLVPLRYPDDGGGGVG
jgi:hypothetical protein